MTGKTISDFESELQAMCPGLVDQNGEETVLHPKLGFFEEVILVLREELPYQWAGGFTKVRKMWERFEVASNGQLR